MSDPPPGGDAGVSDSTRKCALCGEAFSGIVHTGCRGGDRAVKEPRPPSTRAQIDALPPEAAEAAADPDRNLNQYVLVRQIGKGGMGTVWKAWDRNLTRWVAIKFLLASDEDGVTRFRREAQLAARLRHPNIAAIYEVGSAPSKHRGSVMDHYLAMEYVDGQTLAAARLAVPEALEIFLQVARAMDAAHRGGVIHRDLKPANIMITREKWPYVMDFGLAKALETESSLSASGAIMGTPAFMPPEQADARPEEIDARSDVYSLGATLYTVLVGQPPFTGQNVMSILRKVAVEPPPSPCSLKPDLPLAVGDLILKALAKDKKDRPQSAAAFAEELSRCLSDTRLAALPAAAPPGKKAGLMVGAAVLAIAVVLAGIFLAGRTPEPVRPAPPVEPPAAVAPPVPEPRIVRRPVEFPKDADQTFHLRVAVHPYAEVSRILCDQESIAPAERSSPFLQPDLRIGEVEVTLRHPQLGERKVSIPRQSLRAGKTYVIWGKMDGPALQVSESP